MKQLLVIKDKQGNVLECRKFDSRKILENYTNAKYEKVIYDWRLDKVVQTNRNGILTLYQKHIVVVNQKED